MTLLFPDLNVWLALSDSGHSHSAIAWKWLSLQPTDRKLIFSRYTQVGLIRLLTSASVMGSQRLTVRKAWSVYDRWLEDPHVELYPEPRALESAFRSTTRPYASQPASKAIGDSFLLAFAMELSATLITFDRALYSAARTHGASAQIPA